MGLGGYLAARTDRDHYESEKQREIRECIELPEKETEEVAEVFRGYGMTEEQMAPVVKAICKRSKAMGGFHDALRIGLRRTDPNAPAIAPSRSAHLLHRRRSGPAILLYGGRQSENRPDDFRSRHARPRSSSSAYVKGR